MSPFGILPRLLRDVPEYPLRALREAIPNAVMHRDYFEVGANVFVEIYRTALIKKAGTNIRHMRMAQ